MTRPSGAYGRRRTHCVDENGQPAQVDVQARPDAVLELRIGNETAVLSPRQAEQIRQHLADGVAVILPRNQWE